MGKLYLFVLVFVLCFSGTHQEKGKRTVRQWRNSSDVVIPNPRTFKGTIIKTQTRTNDTVILNVTQASIPFDPQPELQLQSNSTEGYLRGPLSTRVIPIIYILLIIVGIPGNISILCAVGSEIRKVSSAIFYCSQAVSNLFLLLTLFFKAHYHLHGNNWVMGEAACRVVTACFYGNLYCSAQTLACITIKRYIAVVHPFMYKGLPKRKCTAWVTTAVWVVFAAAVIPELFIQQSYRLPELGIITCHDVLPLDYGSHVFLLYYNIFLTILGLLAPLGVTVVCYAGIIHELKQSPHDWAMYIKASSLVFAIFLVCFLPAGVLHFLHYVKLVVGGSESLYRHFNVAVCLCCLHACLDPFLFVLMSKITGSSLYLNFVDFYLQICRCKSNYVDYLSTFTFK